MLLPDVNVLVYAHRAETDRHADYRRWLEDLLSGSEAYAVSDVILSGFLRIVTHPRVFDPPSKVDKALAFTNAVLAQPTCVRVQPGPRHWSIFAELCAASGATGNRVPDAYLAALAIESGSDFVTSDRGFARFPRLRWHHPLDD